MPRRASSRGDRGKAPIYAMSYGDSSSDDETISTSEQAAQVLQSYFDRKGDNIRPTGGIPMEIRSKRQCLAEKISASSESHTISTRTSSRHTSVMEKGGSSGATMAEDLIFDLEANLRR